MIILLPTNRILLPKVPYPNRLRKAFVALFHLIKIVRILCRSLAVLIQILYLRTLLSVFYLVKDIQIILNFKVFLHWPLRRKYLFHRNHRLLLKLVIFFIIIHSTLSSLLLLLMSLLKFFYFHVAQLLLNKSGLLRRRLWDGFYRVVLGSKLIEEQLLVRNADFIVF